MTSETKPGRFGFSERSKHPKEQAEIQRSILLKFTASIVSVIEVFHNLSPIKKDPVIYLKSSSDKMEERREISEIVHVDITRSKKDISYEERKIVENFLVEGFYETLSGLLDMDEKDLTPNELLVVKSFYRAINPETKKNYSAEDMKTMLANHFSLAGETVNKFDMLYRKH